MGEFHDRSRGKRFNSDDIRANVLLFIARSEGTLFPPIRKHLAATLGLLIRRPIDLQLAALVDDGILERARFPSGDQGYYLNHYSVKKNFSTFTYAFNFLKTKKYLKDSRPLHLDYMKTKYYIDYVSSEDFKHKHLASVIRDNLLKTYSNMKTEDGYSQTYQKVERYEHVQAESRGDLQPFLPEKRLAQSQSDEAPIKLTQFMEKLKADDTADDLVSRFRALCEGLERAAIDELPDILVRIFEANHQGDPLFEDEAAAKSSFFQYIYGELMSPHEWKLFNGMLRVSPSAINYALNPKFSEPAFMASVTNCVLDTRIFNPGFFEAISRYDLSMNFSQRSSHLFTMVKAYFLADLMDDRLIKADYTKGIVDEILTSTELPAERGRPIERTYVPPAFIRLQKLDER